MAQRRSKNRRLSSRRSNISGFLDDNTNVFENDESWGYASVLRPSMPIEVTQNASSILDANSTVNAVSITENWQNNLTRSDSSRLMEEAVRKNVSNRQINAQNESSRIEPMTESESDTEFQKKRAGYGYHKKQINQSEKSNVFLKAMEKTTDQTRNLTTHQRTVSGQESESTIDESRTMKRPRPRVFGKNKQSNKNETNNFDDILGEDTPTSIQMSTRSSRSSLKRSNDDNQQIELAQKIRRSSQRERIVETLVGRSAVENQEDTIADTPTRELRQRSIPITTLSQKLSQSKSANISKENIADDSFAGNASAIDAAKEKKRPALFSQGNKSKNDVNAFEDALASGTDDNQSEEEIDKTVEVSKTNPQEDIDDENVSDSESSTIPPNIRRTRSHSMFLGRKSGNVSNNSSINKTADKSTTEEAKDISKKSNTSTLKNKSVRTSKTNLSSNSNRNASSKMNTSKNVDDDNKSSSESEIVHGSKSQTPEEESSDDENIYDGSATRNKSSQDDQEGTQSQSLEQSKSSRSMTNKTDMSSQNTKNNSNAKGVQLQISSIEESSDEEIYSGSQSKAQAKGVQLPVSSIEESSDEEIYSPSKAQSQPSPTESHQQSNTSIANESNRSHRSRRSRIASEDEIPSSQEISRRTRSRLLQDKSASHSFDQASHTENSPKREKTRSSQAFHGLKNSSRISRPSDRDQSSKVQGMEENSVTEAIDYEGDTSSIPKHVRRTKLFQKSKTFTDDKGSDETTNNENTENMQSPKSKSNRSIHTSTLRDAANVRVQPKVVLQRMLEKDVVLETSNDSLKENIENGSPRKTKSTASPLKSKTLNELKRTSNSRSNLPNSPLKRLEVTNVVDGANKNAERSIPAPNETPAATRIQNHSNLVTPAQSIASDNFSDDLLGTPHPAQSTLVPTGKPVSRITQFFFRSMRSENLVAETPSPPPATTARIVEKPKEKDIQPESSSEKNQVEVQQANEIEEDVDVDGSDEEVSDYPLLTRQLNDIPYDKDKTTYQENDDEDGDDIDIDATPFLSERPMKAPSKQSDTISTFTDEQLMEAKRKCDAYQKIMEAQMKHEREAREAEERKKAIMEAKLRRERAKAEAEKKKKQKKPIDKAFYVNGKPYKQPKLPRPKKWATDRLYKYLWKCMEPIYGLKTRVKSEKFMIKFSEVVTLITRRKKYENYESDLEDLLVTMAQLNIIETRYDFHRFCSDYMPYSFRIKVVPMMLPGNVRNIPYNPDLVFKPILDDRGSSGSSESTKSRSNNESDES